MFIKTKIVVDDESYSYADVFKPKEKYQLNQNEPRKIYSKVCTINTTYISYYHETENPGYTQIFWSDGHYMFYGIAYEDLEKLIRLEKRQR